MMDFKTVAQQFKAKHSAENQLGFSLLPLLMNDLIANGLNVSHASAEFFQSLVLELFGNESKEVQLYALDALVLLGQAIPQVVEKPIPAPAVVPKEVKKAIIEDDIIRTDHLVQDIPNEDDEGDPFYTPPEDRINLRPEDLAPMEYDEDFCKLIGVDTSKRQNR